MDELVAWLAWWTTGKEKEELPKDLRKKQNRTIKQTNSRYEERLCRWLSLCCLDRRYFLILSLDPSIDPFPVLEMRSNLRAYRLVELLFSSSWDFIPFHSKLLEIFTDRRDIYRFIMRVTLEGRRRSDRLTYHCLCFPPPMTDESFEI